MKKTQIYVLTLTSLTNYKQMAITAFMADALRMFAIADTKVGMFIQPYNEAYEREDEAFRRTDRKQLSKEVTDADTARINALRVIIDGLKIFNFQPDETRKTLAQEVTDVIDLYGGSAIYRLPMDARTGAITNLVQDFQQKLAEPLATLNLTSAVNTLGAANQRYIQAVSNRDLSDSEYGKSTMLEARNETDKVWRAIVETTNNIILFGTPEESAALIPFAKYMNVEIDRYRIQNGQGVGGNWGSGTGSGSGSNGGTGSGDGSGSGSNGGSGTGSGDGGSGSGSGDGGGSGSGTPVMKNATFRFINGTAIVLPFAVGAPVLAPANTLGYKWKPTPGEMPKTNKTFNEVPIDDREVTLTFHFLSHEDEEMRGIVGTSLTAPANTDNCHWEPEVPATFPEEDMTFNEVLNEPASGDGGDGEGSGGESGSGSPSNPQPGEGGSGGEGETEKYTVAWYLPNGNPIIWYDLTPGAEIPAAPAPPEGYRWPSYPSTMPTRDLDIIPEPIQ